MTRMILRLSVEPPEGMEPQGVYAGNVYEHLVKALKRDYPDWDIRLDVVAGFADDAQEARQGVTEDWVLAS